MFCCSQLTRYKPSSRTQSAKYAFECHWNSACECFCIAPTTTRTADDVFITIRFLLSLNMHFFWSIRIACATWRISKCIRLKRKKTKNLNDDDDDDDDESDSGSRTNKRRYISGVCMSVSRLWYMRIIFVSAFMSRRDDNICNIWSSTVKAKPIVCIHWRTGATTLGTWL